MVCFIVFLMVFKGIERICLCFYVVNIVDEVVGIVLVIELWVVF